MLRIAKVNRGTTESDKHRSLDDSLFVYDIRRSALFERYQRIFRGNGYEYDSRYGGSLFAPVPFALLIYDRIFKRHGFGVAFRYALAMFSAGMLALFFVSNIPAGTAKTVFSVLGGVICSLAIGALFSVAYSVPSQLAAEEEEKPVLQIPRCILPCRGFSRALRRQLARI